ncbi:carbohydrate ABC transporter permease [Clostridium grantii]|uniref:Carbohydrate ABC transporter membrane protein 2, CUT1 family (TC 3.A.1.1.-) n=1 Tax=Clostridium grantii DSM 8605 TaxID=1121316 RepID=A0A1M5UVS5_9CLOT|nr:carbohydrate ABC transporter permease [Clostridium grantii]SHH67026.1 carbohydrate ABC transporter membrane protein 2, CUT1 family (TC 3.A.1.1.-) [Clostridium grantii DSM 8605]
MRKNKFFNDEKIFVFINYLILTLLGIMALYPFLYVLGASLSSGRAVDTGRVTLFPVEFTIDAYIHVFKDNQFWISYANTLFYTFVGTLYSMVLTSMGAYALSKKKLMFRRELNLFVAFTMWFNAGMIPTYLNLRDLGFIDSRLGIIMAFGMQAFNIILLRNYFEGVPEAIDEAATIDGANEFKKFFKIYLPLSKPALVTVALFYAIGRWNGFFWTMILIRDTNKISLQVYLRTLIIDKANAAEEIANNLLSLSYSYDTLIYAIIVCSMIPVILVYPYIQKYFTKGIMVGGVKE